jgi:glutamate racemase
MRIALINSGLGLLAAAAALHRLRPDVDLVLAMDPDGMPWGPRTPGDIALRSLTAARAAAALEPDAIVFACNTGTVHALGALRAEFEPAIPVIGTVPAIKPAAAHSRKVAIWATVATTASAYQRQLIADFATGAQVSAIACPGLADAVDAGDEAGTRAAVADAAARTPAGCGAVVLGCTEYELAAAGIAAALPGSVLFGSAAAIAAQALRRAGADPGPTAAAGGTQRAEAAAAGTQGAAAAAAGTQGAAAAAAGRAGTVHVILSGRPAALPVAALLYPEGRLLADRVIEPRAGPGGRAPGEAGPGGGAPGDPGPGGAERREAEPRAAEPGRAEPRRAAARAVPRGPSLQA